MVIRIGAGEVGPSISQLVTDVRTMMEPHTASRLKERKSNKLKDYTTMAGPLGVTQLLLFSRNANSGSTTLRIARCPRGPTIHFRVKNYSLCKDIRKSLRNPKTPGKEFTTSPLVCCIFSHSCALQKIPTARISIASRIHSNTSPTARNERLQHSPTSQT